MNKKGLLKLLFVILVIAISILVPSLIKAYGEKVGNTYWFGNGAGEKRGSRTDGALFCIQQTIPNTKSGYYKCVHEINIVNGECYIDGTKNNDYLGFWKAVAYAGGEATNWGTTSRKFWDTSSQSNTLDNSQKAIYQFCTTFMNAGNSGISDINCTWKGTNKDTALYQKMVQIKNGTASDVNYNIDATITICQRVYNGVPTGHQLLMDVISKKVETPTVNLQFKKLDMKNNAVSGATLEVIKDENVTKIEGLNSGKITSGGNGLFNKISITPTENNGVFKLKIKEAKLNGYIKLPETTLTVHYDKTSGDITSVTSDHSEYFKYNDELLNIVNVYNVKESEPFNFTIKKKFEDGSNLYDKVEFKITIANGSAKINGETVTNKTKEGIKLNDGKINVTDIKPYNDSDVVMFSINETKTADGFIKLNNRIVLTFKYKDGKWGLDNSNSNVNSIDDVTYNEDDSSMVFEVTNHRNKPKELVIQKVDQDGNEIPGIEFDLNVHLARIAVYDKTVYVDGKSTDYTDINRYITDSLGFNLDGYTISYDGTKDGQVDIPNTITDSNGEIKVTVLEAYKMGDVNLNGIVDKSNSDGDGDNAYAIYIYSGESGFTENQKMLADFDFSGRISYRVDDGEYSDVNAIFNVATNSIKLDCTKLAVTAIEKENELYEKEDSYYSEFYFVKDYIVNSNTIVDDVTVGWALSSYMQQVSWYGTEPDVNLDDYTDNANNTMVIENKFIEYEYSLPLEKVNANGDNLGAGFKFRFTVDNAISIDGVEDTKIYEAETNSAGKINVPNIKVSSPTSNIYIEEIGMPDDSKYEYIEPVNVKATYTEDGVVFTSDNEEVIKILDAGKTAQAVEKFKPMPIYLKKVPTWSSQGLVNAKFDVEVKTSDGTTIISKTNKTTNSNGLIEVGEIDLDTYIDKEIDVIFTETKPPEGFKELEGQKVVKIKYDSSSKYFRVIGFEGSLIGAYFTKNVLNIEAENEKVMKYSINIAKYAEETSEPLKDAKFEVVLSLDGNIIYRKTETTNEDGDIFISNIDLSQYKDKTITVSVKEVEAPRGYQLDSTTYQCTIRWKDTRFELFRTVEVEPYNIFFTETPEQVDISGNNIIFTLYNERTTRLEELNIKKIDSVTKEPLKGTEFKLDFEGKLESLKVRNDCLPNGTGTDYQEITDIANTILKTNNDGDILLKEVKLNESNVKLTVTETSVPTVDGLYYYQKYDKSVTYDLEITQDGLVVTGPNTSDGKLKQGSVEKAVTDLAGETHQGYKLNLTFENVPLMDVGGQVWLDGQQGEKNVQAPDGLKNDGKYLPGVRVIITGKYKNTGGLAQIGEGQNTSGNPDNEYLPSGKQVFYSTNSNDGRYSFEGLECPRLDYNGTRDTNIEGYVVKFGYNGIEFNDTIAGKESKAFEYTAESDEFARNVFNARFKTIGYEPDTLGYDYYDSGADLIDTVNGTNPLIQDANTNWKFYRVIAQSQGLITQTDENIDLGLVERYFDLSLSNTINDVHYRINGVEWSEFEGNGIEAPGKNEYSAKLFFSDYNYRFDNYDTDLTTSEERIDSESSDSIPNRTAFLGQDSELEIDVTYKVKVENHTDKNVDEVVVKYKYSDRYDPDSILINKNNDGTTFTNNKQNRTIEIKLKGEDIINGVELKFNLKKIDGNLPEEIMSGLTVQNEAEIISYTTVNGGYIDADSEPGNGRQNEDDYQACDITFTLRDDVRKISGNVAEAANDGNLSSNNISDVTVQLIELVHGDDGKEYEYIWQETKTGNGNENIIVKARCRTNSSDTYTYDVGKLGKGEYKFLGRSMEGGDSVSGQNRTTEAGLIPGTYFVRFIYGDGRVYDATSDVRKYNGQDYKSTVDRNYRSEFYNAANYNGKSTARDNEARRLQVMANTVEIDGPTAAALSTLQKNEYNDLTATEKELVERYYKSVYPDGTETENAMLKKVQEKVLKNTWMCAETSKIRVCADEDSNNYANVYENVNFGLELRPKTKLVLEKYITGLKITPNGVGSGPVVDAKVTDVAKMLNSETNAIVTTEGVNNRLKAIKGGQWYVETDTDILMQGAELQVEYTYVIKDESDVNYLSNTLIGVYSGNTTTDYAKYLKDTSNSIKNKLKNKEAGYEFYTSSYGAYLGEYYYTGVKGSNDELVKSRVNEIKDFVNNGLKLTESSENDLEKMNDSAVSMAWYNSDGVLQNGESGTRAKENIETVLKNKDAFNSLVTKEVNKDNAEAYKYNDTNADYTKTATFKATLAANDEISFPMYMGEIMKYSNAAGRRDIDACPENLNFAYTQDKNMGPGETYLIKNTDETWSHTTDSSLFGSEGAVKVIEHDTYGSLETGKITVSKPTGGDKITPVEITITAISAVALIAGGIFLIKKYVLVK